VSRIPPALHRRLDRLARRAHAFHRLAHHPLCAAYAGEVVRLGRRTRVCRGCALAAGGGAVGLLLGVLLAPPPAEALAGGLVLLAILLGWAAAPRAGRGRPKLLTRLVPAALAGALLGVGPRAASVTGWGAALGAAALVAVAALAWGRRRPDRGPCTGCPEGPPGPACSGFGPIARRERAFQRLAGRWIALARGLDRGDRAPLEPW
jgi:hypothetical protein